MTPGEWVMLVLLVCMVIAFAVGERRNTEAAGGVVDALNAIISLKERVAALEVACRRAGL